MKYLFSLIFFLVSTYLLGQTITWDGGALDNKWSSPDNWDSNTLPTSTDEVLIDSDSVNVDVNVTVKSLELTSDDYARGNYGKLVIANGSKLIIDGNNSTWVAFTIESSSVRNDGELIVRNATTAVSMESFFSTFTQVPSVFVNEGELKIRNCTTSLNLWDVGEFYNETAGNVQIEDGYITGYNPGGQAIFDNCGTIELRNSYFVDLGSASQILNRGSIYIFNSPESGMDLNGDLVNFSSGTITIDTTAKEGIVVWDDLKNNGDITISNHKLAGIYIDHIPADTVVNKGKIVVRNQRVLPPTANGTEDGIHIDEGFLINDVTGIIQLENLKADGLENRESFENHGELRINGTDENGLYLREFAKFTNTGNVYIDSTGQDGLSLRDSLMNFGNININATGLHGLFQGSSSFLQNDGNVHISNSLATGLNLTGSFINTTGSTITIDTTGSNGISINPNSSLVNNFNAHISVDSTGYRGVRINGKLTNYGTLTINRTSYDALWNRDTLHNHGSISISKSYGKGIDKGTVITEPNSIITIQNVAQVGLENINFHNKGFLTIDSSQSFGLNLTQVANSKHVNDGTILISNCASASIKNSGHFTNNGTLLLPTFNTAGIQNTDSIINTSKGVMLISSNWENIGTINLPTISNSGFIYQNSLNPNLEAESSTLNSHILNKGIYINTRSSPSLKNWTNDGLALWGIAGQMSTGAVETVAHKGGFPTNAPSSTWYLDRDLTQAAGDYIYSNNIFIPNSQGVNADTLWFSIDVNSSSIELFVLAEKNPDCSNVYINTFTENISQEWHNPFNWSDQRIPSPCTTAIIPFTKECIIPSGNHARAYRLEAEAGSVLNMNAGIIFTADPN